MKKALVLLTVIGIMVCSLASMSSASNRIDRMGISNRYNGSYYYDVGWADVTIKGNNVVTVEVSLRKNGVYKGRKRTNVKGKAEGNSDTCYSGSVQGQGSQGLRVLFL